MSNSWAKPGTRPQSCRMLNGFSRAQEVSAFETGVTASVDNNAACFHA
jgi:hypothetical protein